MKTHYLTPVTEVLDLALESGACVAASGTEAFDHEIGSWD